MPISEKDMIKSFGHLEDHQYKHFNRALGVQVQGKEHYKKLLDKGGYVPYEKGCEMAEKHNKGTYKPYNGLSKEATSFIRECKQMADSKGNIAPSGRFIEGLKKHGVNIGAIEKFKSQGGFK